MLNLNSTINSRNTSLWKVVANIFLPITFYYTLLNSLQKKVITI